MRSAMKLSVLLSSDLALPQQSVGSLDTSIVPTSDSSSSAIGESWYDIFYDTSVGSHQESNSEISAWL